MSRELVVVDCETTGLGADAVIVEVAAVNVATGTELTFVPHVHRRDLLAADPNALRINRYFERGLFERELPPIGTALKFRELSDMLRGNTFGGSTPDFDARMLAVRGCGRLWHHRLAALECYAAPVMGRPPWDLPGLDEVCGFLGVENTGVHTALGDARAAAECFRLLLPAPREAERS